MVSLTRIERDAIVGLTTAIAVSFLAGFLSYTTANGTVVYDYSTASGLLIMVFGVYLLYRGVRRGVGFVRASVD